MKKATLLSSALFSLIVLSGCLSTPAYDQNEYEKVIRLKVDSLELLSHANDDFEKHAIDVGQVRKDMLILYEYAKNLPNNAEAIEQILIMNDENGALLGKGLKDWEERRVLSLAYISGLSKNVSDGFDQISGLVSKRIKK